MYVELQGYGEGECVHIHEGSGGTNRLLGELHLAGLVRGLRGRYYERSAHVT